MKIKPGRQEFISTSSWIIPDVLMNTGPELSSLPRLFRPPDMKYKLSISIVEPSDILHLKIVKDFITTKNSIVTNKKSDIDSLTFQ